MKILKAFNTVIFSTVLLLVGIGRVAAEDTVQFSCTLIPAKATAVVADPDDGNWGVQLIAGANHEMMLGHLAMIPDAVVESTKNGQLQALRLNGFASRLEAVGVLERWKKLFPQAFVYQIK